MFRPWGFYISVLEESNWKVKVIQVKPDTAKKLLRLYYKTTKDNQAKFTNMVDTFDGFKKLVKMVENQDQKKNLKNQK